jgi:hypothetical protein
MKCIQTSLFIDEPFPMGDRFRLIIDGVYYRISPWDRGLLVSKETSSGVQNAESIPGLLKDGAWKFHESVALKALRVPPLYVKDCHKYGPFTFTWLQLCQQVPHFYELNAHDTVLSALYCNAWLLKRLSLKDITGLMLQKRHAFFGMFFPEVPSKQAHQFVRRFTDYPLDSCCVDALFRAIDLLKSQPRLKHLQSISKEQLLTILECSDQPTIQDQLLRIMCLCPHSTADVIVVAKFKSLILENPNALKVIERPEQLGLMRALMEEWSQLTLAPDAPSWQAAHAFHDFNDLYDYAVGISQRHYRPEEANKAKPFPVAPVFSDQLFEHINTPSRLFKESRAMRNCCYGYRAAIESGSSCFYHIHLFQGVTLELVNLSVGENIKWKVNEIRGFANRPPRREVFAAIEEWINRAKIEQGMKIILDYKSLVG